MSSIMKWYDDENSEINEDNGTTVPEKTAMPTAVPPADVTVDPVPTKDMPISETPATETPVTDVPTNVGPVVPTDIINPTATPTVSETSSETPTTTASETPTTTASETPTTTASETPATTPTASTPVASGTVNGSSIAVNTSELNSESSSDSGSTSNSSTTESETTVEATTAALTPEVQGAVVAAPDSGEKYPGFSSDVTVGDVEAITNKTNGDKYLIRGNELSRYDSATNSYYQVLIDKSGNGYEVKLTDDQVKQYYSGITYGADGNLIVPAAEAVDSVTNGTAESAEIDTTSKKISNSKDTKSKDSDSKSEDSESEPEDSKSKTKLSDVTDVKDYAYYQKRREEKKDKEQAKYESEVKANQKSDSSLSKTSDSDSETLHGGSGGTFGESYKSNTRIIKDSDGNVASVQLAPASATINGASFVSGMKSLFANIKDFMDGDNDESTSQTASTATKSDTTSADNIFTNADKQTAALKAAGLYMPDDESNSTDSDDKDASNNSGYGGGAGAEF